MSSEYYQILNMEVDSLDEEVEEDVGIMVKEALAKLHEQGELIQRLQVQLNLQNDKINEQEVVIQSLTDKVIELSKNSAKGQPTVGIDKEEDSTGGIWKETTKLSLADAVKETAEQTLMTNAGFVFDSTSGLYCNYSTGYYYDPAQSLYYNGHTGIYYTYNADKQEYIFHSQVQIPSNSTEKKKKTDQSKKKALKSANKPEMSDKSYSDRKTDIPHKSKKISAIRKEKMEDPLSSKEVLSKPQKIQNLEDNVKTVKMKKPMCSKDENKTNPDDVEEGELSDSSSESDKDEGMEEDIISNIASDSEQDVSDNEVDQYPPCIRAIIMESSSEEIRKGSLFLVTCMGGTIGREGLHHSIMLPDPEVDKSHAKLQYMPDPCNLESKSEKYFIIDEGSCNGTFLNGKRLSEEKQISDPHEIVHGSILKIGGFSVLMHIHPGSFTCGHCEPGLLIEPDQTNGNSVTATIEKGKSRNAMMRQIKRKYGINGPKQISDKSFENYTDRAQERRVTKGSDNPYEKTQVATLDESIGKTNKGFKMLAKMGWSAGTSLGQTGDQGILEPIKPELKSDRGGLGLNPCSGDVLGNGSLGVKKTKHASSKSKQSRVEQLAITMKRFKEAEASSSSAVSITAEPRGSTMDGGSEDNNEIS